jgi:hypothetical protein
MKSVYIVVQETYDGFEILSVHSTKKEASWVKEKLPEDEGTKVQRYALDVKIKKFYRVCAGINDDKNRKTLHINFCTITGREMVHSLNGRAGMYEYPDLSSIRYRFWADGETEEEAEKAAMKYREKYYRALDRDNAKTK